MELQKASMWKRISAFLFDGILLVTCAVLFAWGLSAALGFDRYNQTLNDCYARYAEEYQVSFDLTMEEYEALSEEELNRLNAAYDAMIADSQAVHAYQMVMQLTILILSLGLFLAFLSLEFFLPLRLGDGRTLGKKIFGLAVMHTEGIRVNGVAMFIRAILGKYTIETMIPVLILLMIYWGRIGIVGPLVIFLILVVQIVVMIATPTNSLIHDLLAKTVTVDYASQRIFESREAMIAYKEKKHAEQVAQMKEA